jgi:restriction system protein
VRAVHAIVLNGWVTYVNRAAGNNTTACIVSLHCEASELLKINLRAVDAKTCFRALKGVASPQINSLTPVRPIINIDRSDKRFVNSQNVIDGMGTGANIAAVGWEEFEHLIRELFEKEFSSGGGEVKVTQPAATVALMLLHLILTLSEGARLLFKPSAIRTPSM